MADKLLSLIKQAEASVCLKDNHDGTVTILATVDNKKWNGYSATLTYTDFFEWLSTSELYIGGKEENSNRLLIYGYAGRK